MILINLKKRTNKKQNKKKHLQKTLGMIVTIR